MPNAQSQIQKAIIQRWMFGVGRSTFSSLQLLLHFRTQGFAVSAAAYLRL